jgi:hypothetical protein
MTIWANICFSTPPRQQQQLPVSRLPILSLLLLPLLV